VTVSIAVLADQVQRAAPRMGSVRLVCIDGPAGSGKTSLAVALADALGEAASVVHMDDLYEGWSGLDGVWARVEEQVLRPLDQGRAALYQRYDWVAERFAEWLDIPIPEVLILEGCGSAPRAVEGRAVLIAWVEAPADVRLTRGLARDGQHMRDHWLRWMDAEAAELAREGTRERADVVVDGTVPLRP
jgi:uridine kinase